MAMEIEFNNDETISVDYWGEKLSAARVVRIELWKDMAQKVEGHHKASKEDFERLEDLFLNFQIDMERAVRALENKGDVSSIPVDPKPEFSLEGENQAISDEVRNNEKVFDVLSQKHGITKLRSYDEKGWALYRAEYKRLLDKKSLLPGLRGV